MSILTSFTAPLASRTTFSIIGCSVLHGPHHGAQKSTITGTVREASSTSLANLVWSLSLMRSAGTACGAAPCSIVSIGPRKGNCPVARNVAPVFRGRKGPPGGSRPRVSAADLVFRQFGAEAARQEQAAHAVVADQRP